MSKTRILSMVLVLCMVMSLFPAMTVAEAQSMDNYVPPIAFTKAYITSFTMDGSVDVVDLTTNTVEKAKIQVGNFPNSAAINPNGKQVFVTNRFDGTVSVINPVTDEVVETIIVENGPHGCFSY